MQSGGVAVGQIRDTKPRDTISYRAQPGQREALEAIHAAEGTTLSKVCEYVMGLGVDLYWARDELGVELDALAEAEGLSRRAALLEALRRGVRKPRK